MMFWCHPEALLASYKLEDLKIIQLFLGNHEEKNGSNKFEIPNIRLYIIICAATNTEQNQLFSIIKIL